MAATFTTKFTFTANDRSINIFTYRSSVTLLEDVLPLIRGSAIDEAVSTMGPYRPRPRYNSNAPRYSLEAGFFGNAPGRDKIGVHRSLRDPDTYRQTISGSAQGGRTSGSVVAASAHARLVHDGRPGFRKRGGGRLRWDSPDGSNVLSAKSVGPAPGNPWLRRALGQGVQRSRFVGSVGFNPSAASSGLGF